MIGIKRKFQLATKKTVESSVIYDLLNECYELEEMVSGLLRCLGKQANIVINYFVAILLLFRKSVWNVHFPTSKLISACRTVNLAN